MVLSKRMQPISGNLLKNSTVYSGFRENVKKGTSKKGPVLVMHDSHGETAISAG